MKLRPMRSRATLALCPTGILSFLRSLARCTICSLLQTPDRCAASPDTAVIDWGLERIVP